MSLHTWGCQGSRKPSSCVTFTLNSHWGRATTGKKILHLCMQGHFGSVQLCDPVDCALPGFSVRGVEIKPQLKPRGSVAKEDDPKPSHQLYKLQIKFT